MNIQNIFKREKDNPRTGRILQANAILYPSKIIVETVDRVKEGFGISSSKITILPVDANSELLGITVKSHLGLTEEKLVIPKDYKQHYSDYLTLTGFKNGKEHHKNALLLGSAHERGKRRS